MQMTAAPFECVGEMMRSREAPQQEERCPVTQGACTVCQTNANWIAFREQSGALCVDCQWP